MPPVNSSLVALGTPLPAFELPDLDGKPVSSTDLAGPALLVAFLSNHCPYVRHIERRLAAVTADLAGRGLSVVGVASNDTGIAPDDDVDGLREQVERAGFTFPYLVDTTQRTARDFRAACTPDLFLYDGQRRLAYRGAFDAARPGNDVPVTGDLLVSAVDLVLSGRDVPEPHTPSLGCGIKWSPDNEPGVVVH
ncbi:thioredoxin family protein [Micromonospora globbae]|uniref:Thioredoxin family protein n=1 Tax=Micromonospora globbae TaxID=1894969 RepID=A0A420F0J9_9ACTN|nr:thioredoxin family protein [Micromonospora globbae]RKF26481.1 thioredoxin family protein [Micromonospora globbae]